MAIVSVTEMGARSVQEDERGSSSYSRRWKVITDSPEDGGKAILASLPVKRGDRYQLGTFDADTGAPVEPWAEKEDHVYCLRRSAQQTDVEGDEDGCTWIATAEYAPWSSDFAGIDNPLDEPALVSYEGQPFVSILDFAFDDGNEETVPVVNTAADFFDPPIEADRSRPILVVTKNVASVTQDWIDSYSDSTNSDVFAGRQPGTVLCKPIRATEQYHSTIGKYVQLQFEFHINKRGWTRKVISAGYRQFNDDATGYATILTETGQPPPDPVPLDADGYAITDPAADLVVLEFKQFPSLPFAAFGLFPEEAP